MLRVLQVIGKMDRAGAESLLMNLYRYIDKSKVQFDFLVFSYEEGDYDKEILRMGGKIYRMPSLRFYNYMDLSRRLKKFFGEHSYKIVHGHMGSLAPMYLHWAKKNGAYTIAHSHATNSDVLLERWIYWFLSHRVVNVADYFFACSEQAGKDRFGEKIVEQSNFEVLKNSIETEKFRYTQERHEALKSIYNLEDKMVLGHVGRFTEAKNHKFLLEIFEKISEKTDRAVLLLVGRGELENAVREQIKEQKLEDKVIFMGVRDDIPDMMNLFDVFVFTSVYEGLGNVCIEAQAAGLPCFVSSAIQDEAILTKNVWRYSLNLSAEKWAAEILKRLEIFERKDTTKEVVEAGYDAAHTAKLLENFYCRHER